MSGAKIASISLPCLALVFLLAGFIANPPAEPEPEPLPPQEFDLLLAREYVEAQCWQCHSVSSLHDELVAEFGEQAAGLRPYGPDLAGVGNRYAADWHAAHFWQPGTVVAGSQMPAQRQLFDQSGALNELGQNVVRFLLTLKTPSPINKPWPTERLSAPDGDAARGRTVFVRECAGCHGDQGHGDGPAARFFKTVRAPAKLADGELITLRDGEAPLDTIYTNITNGLPGTGMPSFGTRLNEADRADVAAYVLKISQGAGSVSPGKD
ncbi:MAG: c-type cytochrome [Planctomycetes bacterium]|nr:c-type cytochrome [Planctomycetota bacterium]